MNLQLSLKRQWFEMTKSGEKKEDYRELTIFWFKRLIQDFKSLNFTINNSLGFIYDHEIIDFVTNPRTKYKFIFKDFTTNTMTLGYPSKTDTERIITFEHAGIEIRTGNPEWGAEPNKLYFVIKHGKQI